MAEAQATGLSGRRWIYYFLPGLIGVLPTLLAPGHIVGDGVDAYGTGWFYWWIRMCVTHFGNPGFTSLFFSPEGKDIFADTGNNFVDALFSVPFQVLFGRWWSSPFILFLLLGNAWSFEQLAKELWDDPRDVFAATLAWMVNPYTIFEITAGRPTQAVLWWVPLALVQLRRVCRGDSSVRTAAGLGVATALTGWTYWFAGYFLVFLMIPLAWWWGRATWRSAARGIAIAVVVCLVLILPMAIPMADAWLSGRVPGVTKGSPEAANVNNDLHGVWRMELKGEPLFLQPAWLIGALLGAWKGGREGRTWLAITVGLVVIGLGARIGDARIPNPVWLTLSHLPFLMRLWFPYRITMVAMIPVVALLLHAWRGFGRSRVAGAAFLAGSLGGEAFFGTFPFNHCDATCPPILLDAAKEPGTFLFLPSGIQSDILLWQTQFQRPTFGGMGESAPAFWTPSYIAAKRDPWLRVILDATALPHPRRPEVPRSTAGLANVGVRWIVLRRDLVTGLWRSERDRGTRVTRDARDAEVLHRLRIILGAPSGADERLVVWDLEHRWSNPEFEASPAVLQALPLDDGQRPGFEIGMERAGRD